MATTETGAASYRIKGRDEDDDKRGTLQCASQTREKEHAHTRYRSGTTVRGNIGSTKRTKGKMQADRGAQGVKTGIRQERHRVSARNSTVNRHARRLS